MLTPRTLATCGLGFALLSCGACAGGPGESFDAGAAPQGEQRDASPEESTAGGPRGGHARPLFISPAGEPFRGASEGPAPMAAWFAQADADHDGRLSRPELSADYDRFFKRLDANGDGVIDGFEAQAYERTIAPELLPQVGRLIAGEGQDEDLFKEDRGGRGRGSRGGFRAGAGSRARGQAAGVFQLFPDPEPISTADTNLDGRVTLIEWRARAAAVFSQLDTAEVGFLTLASLPKTPQQTAIEKRKAALDKKRRP